MYTIQQIQKAVQSKGYKWFTGNKGYDVNIVGVRNSATHGKVTNRFDDKMTLSYKDLNGKWNFHCWDCTTDPGSYWTENIMSNAGVAIVKPGQYRGSHKIGLHQNKYEALRQAKPIKVYRDNNRDDNYDLLESNIHEGIFGINIHKAGSRVNGSTQVDKWSAGCQVFSKESDFNSFMEIVKKGAGIWGNSFSYTLIESKDIT
tara:strand:- start:1435 stop:2040 length:606 start_codon:yes stop_codon:yes gene_type:complete